MSITKRTNKILILSVMVLTVVDASAQDKNKQLTAKESETSNFGWMQGFPPSEDKILHTWDGSFFQFPAIRYSVVHMREFLPTVRVSKGLKPPSKLNYELDSKIDGLTFMPWNAKKKMTWEQSLQENYTDGMIILHEGKVVYERYFSELNENEIHAVMSLTKSFNGTLASILVAEGKMKIKKYHIMFLS